MVQKQMGVSLPDGLRKMLENASVSAERSIAEEIRVRLLGSFVYEQINPAVRNFMAEIGLLALLTERQTARDWRTHAGANAVLRNAIYARLGRATVDGPEDFIPGELPSRGLVASDDPKTIGVGLESHLEALLQSAYEFKGQDAREFLLHFVGTPPEMTTVDDDADYPQF